MTGWRCDVCGTENGGSNTAGCNFCKVKPLPESLRTVKQHERAIAVGTAAGMEPDEIARMVADRGNTFEVMQKLCEVAGLELVRSETVRFGVELKPVVTPEVLLGDHIARTLTAAQMPRDTWLKLQYQFRLNSNGLLDIASEGVTQL